jgi:hypothetical protein
LGGRRENPGSLENKHDVPLDKRIAIFYQQNT